MADNNHLFITFKTLIVPHRTPQTVCVRKRGNKRSPCLPETELLIEGEKGIFYKKSESNNPDHAMVFRFCFHYRDITLSVRLSPAGIVLQ